MQGAGRTWKRACCLALPACLLSPTALAQAPAEDLPLRIQAAPPHNELFLEVSVNGEASGLILRFTRGKTGLHSTVQNLRDLGQEPKLFGLEGQEEFDLDQVRGLSYEYDASRQTLSLRVSDALREPVQLSARTVRQAAPASVTPGALLNYDIYGQLGKDRSISLLNEVRYFSSGGVFSSNGVWNVGQGQDQYTRFDTYWSHSDPDTLTSWQLGDLVSSSLSWSRSVRLGGVQWRKNFELRPDLLTYPVAAMTGSAVVPSAVDLYIDGVRQVQSSVPSGPFVVRQIAGINGAGQATLVTRDAAGRAVSTTVSMYVDTRLLTAGLSDYSLELGALRRRYGLAAFDYAHTPSASGELRHGVSDQLTVAAHGEAGKGLLNGGGGALLALGQAGVLSVAVSGSSGPLTNVAGPLPRALPSDPVVTGTIYTNSGSGGQAVLGYQYLSRHFSIDAQSLRASKGYSDLGTAEGSLSPLATDRLTLNLALPGGQSLGLSYVGQRAPLAPAARIVSAAYAATLGQGLYASLSAFRDMDDAKTRGVFFSLSMTFGDHIAANASRSRQNGVATTAYSMTRAPDYGGGFGWGLQELDTGGSKVRQAQGQYLGDAGQLNALVQDNDGKRGSSLDLSGALVLMDGSLQATRQVGAGFAMVSTDGVAGVPVLQENRVVGKTDQAGYLLVPNLNPYLSNLIAIDTTNLPIDARIATTSRSVVPAQLSGVLARFPVEKYAAASVILLSVDGKPLAAGTEVVYGEGGARTVVGFDGLTFVDHLQADNHLLIGEGPARCVVQFSYVQSRQPALPVLGPFTCKPLQ